ncbi:hypothetical protein BH11PSE8_BH11PSE8_45760 [soil metagenome]
MAIEQDSILEFRDSEVANIAIDGATVVVKFSAAFVYRQVDGSDEESGYLKSLELACSGSSVLTHDPGCVGRISAGLLTVDGRPMERVAIPHEAMTDTLLELTFTNGSCFRARASGVAIRVAGVGRFVESFAC